MLTVVTEDRPKNRITLYFRSQILHGFANFYFFDNLIGRSK